MKLLRSLLVSRQSIDYRPVFGAFAAGLARVLRPAAPAARIRSVAGVGREMRP